MRLQLQTYEIPHPGNYLLRVTGLGMPQARDGEHAIVFTKPHLAAVVGHILAIIVAAWMLIGGIVLFALTF